MKKIVIIGIGELYKHQLEWIYDILPTEELKQMFLNGQIDLYDMTSYPEKGDAIDAILRDADDIATVVAYHIYWQKDLAPIKIPYFYNEKNEYLPIITKELSIPFIVMGDQPDSTFAHVKIYNMDDHRTKILFDVPLVRQSTNYSCGSSALQAVFGYYGKNLREEDIIKGTNTNPNYGARQTDLVKFAKDNGLSCNYLKNLTIDEIKKNIQADHPVILHIQAWPKDSNGFPAKYSNNWDDGHYVVMVGFDDQFIYLVDPSILGGHGFIPLQEFLIRWHGYDPDNNKVEHEGIIFFNSPNPLPKRQYTE